MLMRNLGRTGLKVSAFCLGTNTFGRMTDQAASDAVLDAFVEGGGNVIDTADVYGRGDSETILGNWLKARGKREAAIVATKVGLPMGEGPNEKGLSRQRIMAGVEASLRRLQTDYIDVYQAHRDDRETPLDETLRGFDDLVGQGKVRYVACSNYVSWRLAEARGATPAQVALAWIVQRPGITAPIASATSPEQLRELLGSVELNLDAEALAQLDQASAWK